MVSCRREPGARLARLGQRQQRQLVRRIAGFERPLGSRLEPSAGLVESMSVGRGAQHRVAERGGRRATRHRRVEVSDRRPNVVLGRSFAGQLLGVVDDPVRDVAIAASHTRSLAGRGPTTPVVYTERWAYAPCGMRRTPELFDLRKDPCCENSVAKQHPRICQRLHQRLLDWLREYDAPPEAIAVFE